MIRKHYKLIGAILFLIFAISLISYNSYKNSVYLGKPLPIWDIRSIDTMKYSRDTAEEALGEPEKFKKIINDQVSKIASTSANYVAIATPYDEKFLPVLRLWVIAARKSNLKVWFRGNWSGWEGWFGFEKIDRATHIQKTKDFILTNTDLFLDGDIFNACPECENGGPGDPRNNGDVKGHRKFLIDEYKATKEAFAKIGRNVASNYFSMNADVAKLVMDKATTSALDNLVVIDHYVASTDALVSDIKKLSQSSGGLIALGEFGAPIPDIHGNMNETDQAKWIEDALNKLSYEPELVGINYWVGFGGSSKLWNDDGTQRQAVETINKFYNAKIFNGIVINELDRPIDSAKINFLNTAVITKDGRFAGSYAKANTKLSFSADGYLPASFNLMENSDKLVVTLERQNPPFWWGLARFLHRAQLI